MKQLKFLILVIVGLLPTVAYGQTIQTISDEPTLNNYSQALTEQSPSTRRAGRIWSDKTVYGNGTKSISVDGHQIDFDDDFLEVYSALGSNYELGETKNTPIDLVLTVDCSISMGAEIKSADFDSELNRKPLMIDKTAESINKIIDYLMNQNENNQISIVVYQDKAKVVFPLGRYSHNDQNPFVNVVPNKKSPGDLSYYYTITFNGINEASSDPITVSITSEPDEENESNLGSHTNFQTGLFTGLKQLADNKNAKITGNRAKIISLSDGAPNAFYTEPWNETPDSSTVYNLNNSSKELPDDSKSELEALILQSILSTSYLKTAIAKNYNYQPQLIVLQIDSGETPEDNSELIWNGILNKDDYLNEGKDLDNKLLSQIYKDFQSWKKGEEVKISNLKYFEDGFKIVQFPEDNPYGISKQEMIDNINIADLFEIIPSTEQSQVFQDLVQGFSLDEFHPIKTEGTGEYNSILTYEEPIGRYMQVSPKKMILFDKEYDLKKISDTQTGSILTEVFTPENKSTETIKNESYSEPVELDISQIEFIVETKGDTQKVKIKIPEECVPILTTMVEYSQNYDDTAHREINSIEDNRDNQKQSEPIRFIYGVNLMDSIKNEDNTVNVSEIDPEYLKEHLKDDSIEFFTTEFLNTSTQYDKNKTSGEAFTTFIPSIDNDYYNAQEELSVYVDKKLNEELVQSDEISDNKEYYLPRYYYGYEGKEPKLLEAITPITGNLIENVLTQSRSSDSESTVTIKPGLNCIGDLHNYSVGKNKNLTETASLVYYPYIDSRENPENLVRTYLGNNGKMALPVRFDIKFSITKYQAIGENSLTKDRLTVCASDIVTYQLRICNLNNYSVKEILISDKIPEGLEFIPDSMEPGGVLSNGTLSWLLDFEPLEERIVSFKVKVPNVDQADYKNFFTIEYEDNQNTVTMDSNIVEATVEPPDLELTKYQAVNNLSRTQEPQKVNSGDYLTYYFEVHNKGNGRATNITVTDPVPNELVIDPNSISNNGKLNNNNIVWNLEKLDPNEAKLLSFSVHIPENSVNNHWENTATVSHDLDPTPESSNTVVIDKNPINLSIEKLQAIGNQTPVTTLLNVNPGEIITYYLKITNNSAIIINNVEISDNVASDLTVVENSISDNGIVENNLVKWIIPSIDPGTTVQVNFKVQIPQNNLNKSWNNIATLTADELDNNPIQSNVVTIQEVANNSITPVNSNSSSSSNSNSSSRSVSNASNNPKTGVNSNYNALIWLIGLIAVLILTGHAYRAYKD